MTLTNRFLILFFAALGITSGIAAQCENWVGKDFKDRAESAHVSYRNFVRNVQDYSTLSAEDFELAFGNWQTAYELAPAADGERASHFRDGREFYRAKHKNAADAAQKTEFADVIISLYDQEMECYPDNRAFLLGRKAMDMFYLYGDYRIGTIDVIEEAMEEGGLETEYVVFIPLGELITYHFGTTHELEADRARELYEEAVEIGDYHVENDETYGEYYQSAEENMIAKVREVETDLFDCDYFKDLLLPTLEGKEEDLDAIFGVYQRLVAQGCAEDDPVLVELKADYDRIHEANAEQYEAELRRDNPGYDASKLEQEGEYARAVERYEEAVATEEDAEKKSNFLYRMAAIQMSRLGQLSSARSNARRAAEARPGWGKPYILIGDIYARMGRNCGDSWNQRLAILAAREKYRYARSIDSGSASEANSRISQYNGSLPTREEAFSRNLNSGAEITVGCGINETVTLELGGK
ncbi:MAG: hypothetical protein AAGF87_01075 [Bacteroidota bacterium]